MDRNLLRECETEEVTLPSRYDPRGNGAELDWQLFRIDGHVWYKCSVDGVELIVHVETVFC